MAIKIVNADIIEWAKNYKGPQCHALMTDAPYELNFMNKSWDASGIAFNPDTWRALAEHLLPGAFLFVFAGTLNDDLISVAMRQAGLRKFHKSLAWGFSSGFPKASRIDSIIDRMAGAKRKIVGRNKYASRRPNPMNGTAYQMNATKWDCTKGLDETAPATPLAKTWAGHRYGLQSLKPSVETILIFCKPFEKGTKPVESITKNGAGALNIDGARITGNVNAGWNKTKGRGDKFIGQTYNNGNTYKETQDHFEPDLNGRWPANLLLVHHSPDCNGVCSPECAIRLLDEQTGISGGGNFKFSGKRDNRDYSSNAMNAFNQKRKNAPDNYGDTGGASRFFFQADWNYEAAEKIENAAGVRYQAKAARKERNYNLDDFYWRKNKKSPVGFDRISFAEWKKLKPEDRAQGNIHSTVKPLSLTKYLATLLACPAEYAPRRIVIPFAGVMSEAIGCMLSNEWEEIIAIEKEKDYCDIGAARVKYWEKHKLPEKKAKIVRPVESAMLQESLFE